MNNNESTSHHLPDAGGLPQLAAPVAITDGGLETTLVFDDGFDLPHFAAFVLLYDEAGRTALARYVSSYTAIAATHRVPLVVETPTWRANPDWGTALGLDAAALADVNRRAVEAIAAHRDECELVISGCIGPRGDGYVADTAMSVSEATEYHRPQIVALRAGGADLVSALTMTNVAEATGIALAAQDVGIECVIAFTTETDGRLPSGEALPAAIDAVDAATDRSVAYFMINCAHPTHFAATLEDAPWMRRVRALRSNASTMSHEELDAAEELDAGDPHDLAARYADLRSRFPWLTVFGGCCGTGTAHVAAMATALTPTVSTGV